MEAAICS